MFEKSAGGRVAVEQTLHFDTQQIWVFADTADKYVGHSGKYIFKTGATVNNCIYVAFTLAREFLQHGIVKVLLGVEMAVKNGGAYVDSA